MIMLREDEQKIERQRALTVLIWSLVAAILFLALILWMN